MTHIRHAMLLTILGVVLGAGDEALASGKGPNAPLVFTASLNASPSGGSASGECSLLLDDQWKQVKGLCELSAARTITEVQLWSGPPTADGTPLLALAPQSVGNGMYEFSITAPQAANLANPLLNQLPQLANEDLRARDNEHLNVRLMGDAGLPEAEGELFPGSFTSTRYPLKQIHGSPVSPPLDGECIVVTVDTPRSIGIDCTINQPNTFTLHLHEGNSVATRGDFVFDASQSLSPDGDSAFGYFFATAFQIDQVRGNNVYIDSDARGFLTAIGAAAGEEGELILVET